MKIETDRDCDLFSKIGSRSIDVGKSEIVTGLYLTSYGLLTDIGGSGYPKFDDVYKLGSEYICNFCCDTFSAGQMPFLLPNQQHQSTIG